MDEREKRQIGERIEPGGRPKAPGRLGLLQRFVNTWNHELPVDWDRLGTQQEARTWLRSKGLIAARVRVTAAEVTRLRELREAIRSLVVANTTGRRSIRAIATVRRAGAASPIAITLDRDGMSHLRAAAGGVDGAIATLLGILHDAQRGGDWHRLKGCRQCRYAFFDLSKNRSAAWCSMSICGNRSKNRSYYQRRRSGRR